MYCLDWPMTKASEDRRDAEAAVGVGEVEHLGLDDEEVDQPSNRKNQ
jgi:hypothetical protein